MIKNNNNWSFLYLDKIHLNDEHGGPFFFYKTAADLPSANTLIINSAQKMYKTSTIRSKTIL